MASNSNLSIDERFNKIKSIEEQKKESILEFGLRNVAQGHARIAESILGTPGNLKKAYTGLKEAIVERSPQFIQDVYGQMQDYEKQNAPKSGSALDYLVNPPTSGEIKENITKPLSKAITGNENYLEPQNQIEKSIGETQQDIASMFLPGGNKTNLFTKIGVPIAANMAKEGLKFFGVSDDKAEKAKIGLMFAGAFASEKNATAFANNRIQQGKSLVPDNATTDAMYLIEKVNPLVNKLKKGIQVPSKSKTFKGLDDLLNQVDQNGRINIQSLMQARDNINEWISEAKGFDVAPVVRDASVRNLNQLKSSIIDTIDNALQNRFPQAAELYSSGYQAASAVHQSQAVSNFIEKNFGRKVSSVAVKTLFPSLAAGGAVAPKAALTGAVAIPIYDAGKVLYQISKSPTLSKYYEGVLRASIEGNSQSMIRNMTKLDEEFKKEEDKQGKNKKMSLQEFKNQFNQK